MSPATVVEVGTTRDSPDYRDIEGDESGVSPDYRDIDR